MEPFPGGGALMEPRVDVVIAVHSSERPIARAVSSVIAHNSVAVRVSIVAHNLDPRLIQANLGDLQSHPSLRLFHLEDGIHSPSGPFNLGIAEATAPFISIMGSDDELEPGAVDSWVAMQARSDAEIVLSRIMLPDGRVDPAPPARPRRTRDLDPVKDRLSYRSAPLGIYATRRFGHFRFPGGLKSGEDVPFVVRLWFSGARIAYDRYGPAYVVNADNEQRVTTSARPVSEDFDFLDHILNSPDLSGMTTVAREALATKLIRANLFDAVLNRSAFVDREERETLASVARRIVEWAPGAVRVLSLLDRRVLEAIADPAVPTTELRQRAAARARYATVPAVLTRNPLYLLHRQAPLRTLGAGYLAR